METKHCNKCNKDKSINEFYHKNELRTREIINGKSWYPKMIICLIVKNVI